MSIDEYIREDGSNPLLAEYKARKAAAKPAGKR
jgi:hypothetical protein